MKVKVKIKQVHFAYIDSHLMNEFNIYGQVVNLTSFILESFYEQFHFRIIDKSDIERVDEIVKENFYQDKAEWLREIMRNRIRDMKNKQ